MNPILNFSNPPDVNKDETKRTDTLITEPMAQPSPPEGSIPASYPDIVAMEWGFVSVPWAMSIPAVLFEDYGRKALLVIPRMICGNMRVRDGEVQST